MLWSCTVVWWHQWTRNFSLFLLTVFSWKGQFQGCIFSVLSEGVFVLNVQGLIKHKNLTNLGLLKPLVRWLLGQWNQCVNAWQWYNEEIIRELKRNLHWQRSRLGNKATFPFKHYQNDCLKVKFQVNKSSQVSPQFTQITYYNTLSKVGLKL